MARTLVRSDESTISTVIFGIQSIPSSTSNDDYFLTSSSSRPNRPRNFKLPVHNFPNKVELSSAVYSTQCCRDSCVLNFSPNEIWQLQHCFLHKSEAEQKRFLLSFINDHATTALTTPNEVIQSDEEASVEDIPRKRHRSNLCGTAIQKNFILRGRPICDKAFCRVQGVSEYKLQQAHAAFATGCKNAAHGNAGKNSLRRKTTEAVAWAKFFLERIGDYMPHNNKIYVPPAYNFTILYDRMREEFTARGITDLICYGHFTKMLNTRLPEFILGKVSTFTKCSVCTNLKEEKQTASSPEELDAINKIRALHIKHVELSRAHYHESRERARRDPSAENTIIIDGMDQSKTNLPSLLIEDKTTTHAPRLRTHVTGALFHTDVAGGVKVYAFTDIHNIPHDSNLTIHILLQVISANATKKGKKLNVQMDNCFRENKNRFLLGLGFLLVQVDMYDRVDFNFLPVGHTHEDVDQFFSRIAEKLRFNNVYTLDDLHHVIERSYTPKVEVRHIYGSEVHNVKEWLSPHIMEIGNHSKPHHFRFCKVDSKTQMFYRNWACDPWRPNDVEEEDPDVPLTVGTTYGLTLLKDQPDMNICPSAVIPTLEKLDPALPKLVELFGRRLPEAAKLWWRTFLSTLDNIYTESGDDLYPWPLAVLAQEMPASENAPQDFPHLNSIEDDILKDCPEIIIGSHHQNRPAITRVDDFSSIAPGMMIAVYVKDKTSKPQIGRVLQIEDHWIEMHWYIGQWNNPQKPSYVGAGRNRKAVSEWLDQKCALLWDFSLTSKNSALPRATQIELKSRYSEIEQVLSTCNED